MAMMQDAVEEVMENLRADQLDSKESNDGNFVEPQPQVYSYDDLFPALPKSSKKNVSADTSSDKMRVGPNVFTQVLIFVRLQHKFYGKYANFLCLASGYNSSIF